jgi:hypothetical protein
VQAHNKEKLINNDKINKSMPKYPISTILWLAKQSIKDKIHDALKLHNNIDAYIIVEVKNKNGNIIKRHKQRSHSFVANFLNGLYNIWSSTNYPCSGSLANSSGILIGTGTTPPSPQDTSLTNPIANGTGSGQMVYPSSPTFGSVKINGNTSSFTIQSTITNNSGASITVTEVGLYGTPGSGCKYNTFDGLFTHDLLSSPITVPNGTAITITYTISVTT